VRPLAVVLAGLALLGAALAGPGCSERPRVNPFDPGNPATGGRPSGFQALAENGLVVLRWNPASAPGLFGFQVYRSLAPASGFAPVSSLLSPRTTGFTDPGLLNGVDHYYRLYFVFDRGLGTLYASDVATPGPLTPWVIDDDTADPALARLSADGRHVAERIRDAVTYSAGDVDVDRVSAAVWTCDPFLGGVTIYQPSNGILTRVTGGVSTPVSVAVDPVDHSAWVGDNGMSRVAHIAPDGTLATPPEITSVSGPMSIAVDPVDESVWICERTGSRVRHARKDGTPLATAFVINPSRVAVDSVSGDAWVTSFSNGRVMHLTAAGVRADSVSSLAGPLGIVVDARRGRIWVTDPRAGVVAALTRAGATQFTVSALPGASDVALDRTTGEVWVTAQSAGQVVRVAPDGRILRRLGGFIAPDGIALDPGPGAGPRPAGPARGARPTARN